MLDLATQLLHLKILQDLPKNEDDNETISNWNPSNTDQYNTAVLANLDYPRKVDKIEYDEDFRIPTYGNQMTVVLIILLLRLIIL